MIITAEPSSIAPRGPVQVSVQRADGRMQSFDATAAVETQLEVELLRAGGVIPSTLQKRVQAYREETAGTMN
jgi:aconitate hydratase